MPLVRLQGVTKRFGRAGLTGMSSSPVLAVDDVYLDIEKGDTFGLVGESGSGKSTLGRLILRLLPLTAGTIVFQGVNISEASRSDLGQLRREGQMIFQDPYASLNPSFTVEQILNEGARRVIMQRERRRQRIVELLDLVGIAHRYLRRLPRELSGGQRQRVGIARALSVNPTFIIADEPTSALDVSIQAQILNLFIDLQMELGLTYMFISHDLRVVQYMCNRVAVMYRGRIVESGHPDNVFQTPRDVYTQRLVASMPQLSGWRASYGAAGGP